MTYAQALVEIAHVVLEDIGGDKLARIGEICRQALGLEPPMAQTKLMYARPVSETVRSFLPSPGLVLVEVPPNCAVDGETSEVRATLQLMMDKLNVAWRAGKDLDCAEARSIAITLESVRNTLEGK